MESVIAECLRVLLAYDPPLPTAVFASSLAASHLTDIGLLSLGGAPIRLIDLHGCI